jgi:nucleotidyltransferase substrate binding protein (TIGR01987 family)
MDVNLQNKIEQLYQMLVTLDNANKLYTKQCGFFDPENLETYGLILACRDSVIQRLEYTVDGFWKVLKLYMETVLGLAIAENGPKPITRTAALRKIISEDEAAKLIEMIVERNKTSHMYREEIADEIAKHAPKAHKLMFTILERLHQNAMVQ